MDAERRFGDRFVIQHEVGSGGMGTVYRARDLRDGRTVALKVLRSDSDRARFEREARVLADLRHPGIVRYVAHGTALAEPGREGAPYLVMEWLEGEDLDRRLERGKLPVDETLALARRVSEALAAAHERGVVHRDLKPANIFLVGGEIERVVVVDFGIALGAAATRATATGTALGTPGYMAPEQARGDRALDARADVYSLGCVLFECLTGRPAFSGEHVIAILAKILFAETPRVWDFAPETPFALDELVARMISKQPERRPKDARAVLRALDELGDGPDAPLSIVPAVDATERTRLALSAAEQALTSIVVLEAPSTEDAVTLPAGAETPWADDVVLEVGKAFGAQAEKLLGGSLVFTLAGARVATDQAARAASCALALAAAVPHARVALATGRAAVGVRLSMEAAIDRAAALSQRPRAPGGGVVVDDVTAALLDERFHTVHDELGIVLTGRREVDRVRTLLGKPSPCVGRDGELAMLAALVEQSAAESVARAVLVTAPAGIGKSRLRHELIRALRGRSLPIELWSARGDPIGAGGAFALAAQAVRRAAEILEGEPLPIRQAKLRARVGRVLEGTAASRVADFLGEMIGTPFSDGGNVPLSAARRDPILLGDQIRRAWEDLIDAETAAHPMMLVLDDLHWGDLPTVGLIDAALRLFPERPLMVLAFARPEVDDRFPGLWGERAVQRVTLLPLPRRASARFVRAMLGDEAPDRRVEDLVDHAAGNAFYLEELVRAEAEKRTDRLPETVLAMVESRLAEQGPEERKVLRAGSIFGQAFWEDAVVTLLGAEEDRESCRQSLERLVRSEFLTARPSSRFVGESEYAFRHAIIREAAYGTLIDADRELGHRMAARWLEHVGERDAMVLAVHLERAGDGVPLARAWARAAEQALEGNDLEEAIARARRGARAGGDARLLSTLALVEAEAHFWRGENAEAARAAALAMRGLPVGSDAWGDAAGRLVLTSGRLGSVDTVAEIATMLLDGLGETAGPGCLRGAATAAAVLFMLGRPELARRLLASVEATGRQAAEAPTVRAIVCHALAIQAQQAGDPARYLELHEASAAAFEEAGDARGACSARVGNVPFALLEVGAFAEAESCLLHGLAAATRMGLMSLIWSAKQNLSWALARRGRLDEAARLQRECVAAFRAQGNVRLEGGSRTYLAAILLATNALDAAETEARAATELLEAAPPLRPLALAVLGQVLLQTGRTTAAKEAAREAMQLLDAQGGHLEEGEGLVRLVHIEALRACGDDEGARRALAVARDRLMERARGLGEERARSFLRGIPEHARTLALAGA